MSNDIYKKISNIALSWDMWEFNSKQTQEYISTISDICLSHATDKDYIGALVACLMGNWWRVDYESKKAIKQLFKISQDRAVKGSVSWQVIDVFIRDFFDI